MLNVAYLSVVYLFVSTLHMNCISVRLLPTANCQSVVWRYHWCWGSESPILLILIFCSVPGYWSQTCKMLLCFILIWGKRLACAFDSYWWLGWFNRLFHTSTIKPFVAINRENKFNLIKILPLSDKYVYDQDYDLNFIDDTVNRYIPKYIAPARTSYY